MIQCRSFTVSDGVSWLSSYEKQGRRCQYVFWEKVFEMIQPFGIAPLSYGLTSRGTEAHTKDQRTHKKTLVWSTNLLIADKQRFLTVLYWAWRGFSLPAQDYVCFETLWHLSIGISLNVIFSLTVLSGAPVCVCGDVPTKAPTTVKKKKKKGLQHQRHQRTPEFQRLTLLCQQEF